jgi:hypothetical protein
MSRRELGRVEVLARVKSRQSGGGRDSAAGGVLPGGEAAAEALRRGRGGELEAPQGCAAGKANDKRQRQKTKKRTTAKTRKEGISNEVRKGTFLKSPDTVRGFP